MRSRRPSPPGDGQAAQTQLDFLVGMTTFLLVVGVTLSTMPTLVTPFAARGGTTTMAADSIATQLTSDVLTDPADRYVLEPDRVDAFFDGSDPGMDEKLGLDGEMSVNVTLDTPTGTLTAGPTPPEGNAGVATAWRVVSHEGERAILTVRVWK